MLSRGLLSGLLILHVPAVALFWWLQPRGFTPWTAPFIEHEVLAPVLFAASLAGAAGAFLDVRVALAGAGLLSGFCMTFAAVTLSVGSTVHAFGLGALALVPLAMALVSLSLARKQSIPLTVPLASLNAGAALGAVFLVCTWAPPATTRPSGPPVETIPPSSEAAADLELSPGPGCITIHRREGRPVFPSPHVTGRGHVTVFPFMEWSSASASGHWTVFDFRRRLPSGPPSRRDPDGSLSLTAGSESFKAQARAWIQDGEVHILSVNTLETAIAAHLATAVRVYAPGPATIHGHPWRGDEPWEFVAFRKGRLELLRAARGEKGPFTLIAALPPGDPVIETGSWKIQVRGWADQASRAESPTAGWGVSQGAIESDGDTHFWSLAATSVGRGFHAVRTAPGTYTFEIVVTPVR